MRTNRYRVDSWVRSADGFQHIHPHLEVRYLDTWEYMGQNFLRDVNLEKFKIPPPNT